MVNQKEVSFFTPTNNSISKYLIDISKNEILPEKNIRDLLVKAKKGDSKSIEKIIKSYQKFVFSIAKPYSNRNSDLLCDLVNEANVGLLKSIKTYDSKFENKFYTYAVHWMRKEICDYLTYIEPTIKKSNKNKSSSKVKKLSNNFLLKNGRLPATNEIKEILYDDHNIEVLNDLDIYNLDIKSFSDNLYDETDDAFEYENNMSTINYYENTIDSEYNKIVIDKSLGILNEKETQVIKMLFGINQFNETNIEQVAYELNMTNEGIRSIKNRALDKMRENIIISYQQI